MRAFIYTLVPGPREMQVWAISLPSSENLQDFFLLCLKNIRRMRSSPIIINLIHRWALELADTKLSSVQKSDLLFSCSVLGDAVIPRWEILIWCWPNALSYIYPFPLNIGRISQTSSYFLNSMLCSVSCICHLHFCFRNINHALWF